MSPRARQTKRAWAGAGIIALLVLSGTFIFLLDGILARLRPTYTVYGVLQQATGVTRGVEVWVSGRPVGSVLEVGLLPNRGDTLGRVGVLLELPAGVREQVRRDSRVRLTSERLIGAPALDILAGSPSSPRLRAGDTIYQTPPLSAAAVSARARGFRLSLDSALAELRTAQAPLRPRLVALERVQQQLARAQLEYAQFAGDVRSSPTLNLLEGGSGEASLARSRATLAELWAAVEQLRERARTTGAMAGTEAVVASAGELQRSLAALDSAMRVQGGTLDRLARDSALVLAIAGARSALDSLIADAKRRPFRYLF